MTEQATDRVRGWANAIVEVAKAEGSLETVEDELFRVARTLDGSDELRQTLTDENLPAARRLEILDDLFGAKMSPLTVSVVGFLVSAGRTRQLPEIIGTVVELAAAERQQVVAEVRSAALGDDRRQRLAEALSSSLGKQVDVKVVVDPTVLGGLLVRVGDTVIDGTVRRRLEELREVL